MSKVTRRDAIKFAAAAGVAGVTAAMLPTPAAAEGFLVGKWVVRCPVGHQDTVDALTRNHKCEKCGRTSVDGGAATVVCPNGHGSLVSGITTSHTCPEKGCNKECKR